VNNSYLFEDDFKNNIKNAIQELVRNSSDYQNHQIEQWHIGSTHLMTRNYNGSYVHIHSQLIQNFVLF